MRFQWNETKNKQNLRKHDVQFETAELVFQDPHAVTIPDTLHDERAERYITIGAIGAGSILFVVHTWDEYDDEEVIRIISARAASARERKIYEEAYKRTEAGHRRNRR